MQTSLGVFLVHVPVEQVHRVGVQLVVPHLANIYTYNKLTVKAFDPGVGGLVKGEETVCANLFDARRLIIALLEQAGHVEVRATLDKDINLGCWGVACCGYFG